MSGEIAAVFGSLNPHLEACHISFLPKMHSFTTLGDRVCCPSAHHPSPSHPHHLASEQSTRTIRNSFPLSPLLHRRNSKFEGRLFCTGVVMAHLPLVTAARSGLRRSGRSWSSPEAARSEATVHGILHHCVNDQPPSAQRITPTTLLLYSFSDSFCLTLRELV